MEQSVSDYLAARQTKSQFWDKVKKGKEQFEWPNIAVRAVLYAVLVGGSMATVAVLGLNPLLGGSAALYPAIDEGLRVYKHKKMEKQLNNLPSVENK